MILSQWLEFLSLKRDISSVFGKDVQTKLSDITPLLRHEFNLLRARLNFICQYAKDKDVKIMIDAEQTYYQSAIHNLALEMMQKHNTETCVVYNTYQAYLKVFIFLIFLFYNQKTLRLYLNDLRTSTQYSNSPFLLGAKLVRGAYLEQEKELATYFNLDSPICDSYQDTNLNFLRCLVAIMDSIKNNNGAGIIATHNLDSIKDCIDLYC